MLEEELELVVDKRLNGRRGFLTQEEEDCGADAGSLLTVFRHMVGKGGN